MRTILVGIFLPIAFYILFRCINAQNNHDLTDKEKKRENDLYTTGKTKFYKMGKFRFVLVSISCYEEYVARRVIVMSIIWLVNTLLAIIIGLIAYFTGLEFFADIFIITSGILGIITLAIPGFRNFISYDRNRNNQNKENKK